MSNLGLGLGVIAVIAGIIGFMFLRGSPAKPTTDNSSGDPGWGASGSDGSHGHGHGDGGGGDGGGD